MKLLMRLACFVILMLLPILSHAQSNDAPAASDDDGLAASADYGAGYRMIVIRKDSEYPPGQGVDTDGQGPVRLSIAYPVISNPETPEAKAYNAAIAQLIPRWWKGIGGPKDNNPALDPDTDISLNCMPVGGAPVDGGPNGEAMLPGVISMFCVSYIYTHGYAHGAGTYSGFNWLVSQKRPIRARDIFVKNSGWLKALSALVAADRQNLGSSAAKLDLADSRHWVVGTRGLGFAYSSAEFSGFEAGGTGGVVIIPWVALAPYLKKDGVVPRAGG